MEAEEKQRARHNVQWKEHVRTHRKRKMDKKSKYATEGSGRTKFVYDNINRIWWTKKF